MAIALANEPRLLLMDEPTAGMAPGERNKLMALTRELVNRRGLAVLFTEHSMDVVFGFADRIIVLARGRLIAEGQDEGYEQMWEQANIRNFPALKYKTTTVAGQPVPPPQRVPQWCRVRPWCRPPCRRWWCRPRCWGW